MSRFLRPTVRMLVFVAALVAAPCFAKENPNPPVAPFPPQIVAARSVFISNAVSEGPDFDSPLDLPYDEVYAGMSAWGHYQIVSSPVGADLILGVECSGGTFRLAISDPASSVVLWRFHQSFFHASRSEFDGAVRDTLAQFKAKVEPPPPSPPQQKKPTSIF